MQWELLARKDDSKKATSAPAAAEVPLVGAKPVTQAEFKVIILKDTNMSKLLTQLWFFNAVISECSQVNLSWPLGSLAPQSECVCVRFNGLNEMILVQIYSSLSSTKCT